MIKALPIEVHGRASLKAEFVARDKDTKVRIDLSGLSLFFECPSAGLRVPLIVGQPDAFARTLFLSRAQVEKLPTSASPYTILDETNPDEPALWSKGTIMRVGYVGEPHG